MRKIIILLLCCGILVSMVGCGGNTTPPPTESPPTTVTLKSGKKQNGNLLYTIRPIQEAVDHFNAEQLRKAEREMARLNVIRKLEEYDRKHGIIDGKRSSQQGSQQNRFCWEEVMTPQSTSFSCLYDTETSA